jgi:UDP-glucose 4-epimerase
MEYLITGHKGFIGTNLTNYLKKIGHEVAGMDYPIDLCKVRAKKLSIDVVVHLAAETNVRHFISDPRMFIKNCQSTQTALELARINNVPFVFASSCSAINTTNPYAASKAAGEALCRAYHKSYGLDTRILRFSNVYGPHSKHKDSVIAKFIKAKLSGEQVVVNGTGYQKRDFIHVLDVCKAIHETNNDIMDISTGHLTSINLIIEMLDIRDIVHTPAIDGEIFSPRTSRWPGCKISLENGLMSTLEWFKVN